MPDYGQIATESMTPKQVFAGPAEVNTGVETVPESTSVAELQVMKRDGAGGVVPIAAVDAASLAIGLASHAVTTGAGETQPLTVYFTGEYFESKIVVPDGKTTADYKDALIDRGIYLR